MRFVTDVQRSAFTYKQQSHRATLKFTSAETLLKHKLNVIIIVQNEPSFLFLFFLYDPEFSFQPQKLTSRKDFTVHETEKEAILQYIVGFLLFLSVSSILFFIVTHMKLIRATLYNKFHFFSP